MKAEKIQTGYTGPVFVIVREDDARNFKTLITLEGGEAHNLADGIVRMVTESQCTACGKFNGLHGEIFIKTGQDGGGSVEGYFEMCPWSEEPRP